MNEADNRAPRTVYKLPVETAWGDFHIVASKLGVAMVVWPGISQAMVERRLCRFDLAAGASERQWAHRAAADLKGYLSGRTQKLSVPVDLSPCTAFRRDIYTALMAVPYGETVTYGELAAFGGHSGKARAVGRAMGENLSPIFVPCHRVVSASKGIGGWSGPMGWKEKLLALER